MYRVVWSHAAFRRLETLLARAADPDAVVAAAVELDGLLGTDPAENSESRPDDRRVAFARPLAVLFHLNEVARAVEIVSVWQIRPT